MKNIEKKKMNNIKLGYYLAGLIEGDGYISTNQPFQEGSSKKALKNPRIQITFDKKELPFFEHLQSKLEGGYIYKPTFSNTCRYNIAKLSILIEVINMINGKFRTPKIYCLHKAIDLLNEKYEMVIDKLPLDTSNLRLNS
jgi:hypothetical protein